MSFLKSLISQRKPEERIGVVKEDRKLSYAERHGYSRIQRWPEKDLRRLESVAENFLAGITPDAPFIDKRSAITAFGSCFAMHISAYLHEQGYNVNGHNWKHSQSDLVRMEEILVHTPALRMQFEWALEGRDLPAVIIDGKNTPVHAYDDLDAVRKMIRATSVYIITLGLSEAWFDREQKTYLWKFVPRKSLDSARFENRVISFAENVENIQAIIGMIRKVSSSAHVVFTLSPIPLYGTFRDVPCVVANSASKASLRAAIDKVFRDLDDERAYYFPSYEMVNHLFPEPFAEDNRHVRREVVNSIMGIFRQRYCVQ